MTASSKQGWLSRWLGKGDEGHARTLVREGDAAFARDDFAQAQRCYEEAIAVAPRFAPAHLGRGAALHELERVADAVDALKAALDIDDKLANAHELLAACYLVLSDLVKAEPHLRRAIVLDRTGAYNYLKLGEVLVHQRRYTESLQVVEQGVAACPDFAELHFFLGNLHFETGQFEQAVAAYREAVTLQPDHVMALYNLGLAQMKTDQLDAARETLQRVVELVPGWHEAIVNLGCVFYRQRNLTDAKACFERVPASHPGSVLSHFNLGEIAMTQGDVTIAIDHYRKAVEFDPHFADGHLRLGSSLARLDAREEAITHLLRYLEIAPHGFEALMQLADLRLAQGDAAQALAGYREALAQNGGSVAALVGAASMLQNLAESSPPATRAEMLEEAGTLAQIAIGRDEKSVQARMILGTTLGLRGRLDEADAIFRETLVIDPACVNAHHNLGVSMEERGRQAPPPENMAYLTEALAHYSAVVSVQPSHLDALMGLASIYSALLREEEATEKYEQILQIAPDHAPARMSFGVLKLRAGDFAPGWVLMESRWNLGPGWVRLKSDMPGWHGQADLNGKTIVLYNEQGFGDGLQFIRYAGLLAQRGARVLVKTQSALKQLFATCPGVAEVFEGDTIPPHDFHCSLSSLPGIFDTTHDTIPAAASPYLHAAPERIEHWRRKFGAEPALRVGLVWAGDPRLQDDKMRSLQFDRLQPLLGVPGARFYSLQLGQAASQSKNDTRVIDLTSELTDFQETAALAEHLDLTICVDTSCVHLLGAIGKPVWILNRFNSCWRWMLGRSDSPWYPTARIFRQPQLGDWDSVISEVRQALEIEVARKRSA